MVVRFVKSVVINFMKINKRYCQKCGKVMDEFKLFSGFDRHTGKQNAYIRYVCPVLNWEELLIDPTFNIFAETFMGHYYFMEKQNENK